MLALVRVAAKLFEEERDTSVLARKAKTVSPVDIHWAAARSALAAHDYPIDVELQQGVGAYVDGPDERFCGDKADKLTRNVA